MTHFERLVLRALWLIMLRLCAQDTRRQLSASAAEQDWINDVGRII